MRYKKNMDNKQTQNKMIKTSTIKCVTCRRAFAGLDEVDEAVLNGFHSNGLHTHYEKLEALESHRKRYGKNFDWIPIGADPKIWKDYEINR
jgi:hypothetical protein